MRIIPYYLFLLSKVVILGHKMTYLNIFMTLPPPPLTFMVLKTMCVNGGAGDSNGVMREWVNLLLYYSLVPWLCFVPPCLVYYKHLFFAFSLCQWGTPTITRVARPSSTDCCRLTERYR